MAMAVAMVVSMPMIVAVVMVVMLVRMMVVRQWRSSAAIVTGVLNFGFCI